MKQYDVMKMVWSGSARKKLLELSEKTFEIGITWLVASQFHRLHSKNRFRITNIVVMNDLCKSLIVVDVWGD